MKKIFMLPMLSNLLGIIASILIFISGISTYENADNIFVSSRMKFGADFYTEIYKQVEQILAATRGTENAVYEVGGCLLMALGALSFCYFARPVVEFVISNKNDNKPVENNCDSYVEDSVTYDKNNVDTSDEQ